MEEKKNKSPIIYVIAIILMVACFVGGFFVGKMAVDSNKKDNKTENKEEEKEEKTQEPIYLLDKETLNDLESMRTDLKNLLNSDYNAYDVKCEDYMGSDGYPSIKTTFVKLSNDSVDTIINKLKTAISVEKDVVDGYEFCPPKSIDYVINSTESLDGNKKLIVMYSNDDKTLSVGYNQIGYRYHFNDASEINNFIENLIK